MEVLEGFEVRRGSRGWGLEPLVGRGGSSGCHRGGAFPPWARAGGTVATGGWHGGHGHGAGRARPRSARG